MAMSRAYRVSASEYFFSAMRMRASDDMVCASSGLSRPSAASFKSSSSRKVASALSNCPARRYSPACFSSSSAEFSCAAAPGAPNIAARRKRARNMLTAILRQIDAAHAGVNAAQHAIGDGAGGTRNLLRVDDDSILGAQKRDRVADPDVAAVGNVDGGEVHGNGSNHGRYFAARDDAAAVREPVWNAVGIAGRKHGNAHGARRTVHAAVTDQRAFGN